MALAGIGVDMLEIARMQQAIERRPHFIRRMFTDAERAYCERTARPAEHYAARFAAREAVLKALGTGFSSGIGFQDVSVERDQLGRPQAWLARLHRLRPSRACKRLRFLSRTPETLRWPMPLR